MNSNILKYYKKLINFAPNKIQYFYICFKTQMNSSPTEVQLAFNWARQTAPSLNTLSFLQIQSVGKSESGAAGVVFIETKEGSICVKACTESIGTEYFSHLLYQQNQIEVPKIIVIPYTSFQWNVIKNTIEIATAKDEVVRRSIKSKLQSPMLLLMEYIPNISITYMGPKKAEIIFGCGDENSINRLINLGKIFAMDTIINNSDRYPIIWENNGNPENLLLKVKTAENTTTKELRDPFNLTMEFSNFIAIDNRVNLLDKKCKYASPNLLKYHEKMIEFVKSLLKYLEEIRVSNENSDDLIKILNSKSITQFPHFKRLKKFILKYSFTEIKENSEFLIALGMAICYENLMRTKFKRIENLLECIKKTSEQWKDGDFVWAESLNSINLEFIKDIFDLLENTTKDFRNTLDWIHKITKNKYFIDEKVDFNCQEIISNSLLVNETKESKEIFQKIAGDTSKEIDMLKKQRILEDQKYSIEIKMKIKQEKESRKKRMGFV